MGETKRVVGAASGALGFGTFAAVLASCCGVPWAVAFFGVSGAILLARLAFLMPYAMVDAVALLTLAFWFVYRRAPAGEVGTCEVANRRPLRWIVWSAAILVAASLFLAFYPLLRP